MCFPYDENADCKLQLASPQAPMTIMAAMTVPPHSQVTKRRRPQVLRPHGQRANDACHHEQLPELESGLVKEENAPAVGVGEIWGDVAGLFLPTVTRALLSTFCSPP